MVRWNSAKMFSARGDFLSTKDTRLATPETICSGFHNRASSHKFCPSCKIFFCFTRGSDADSRTLQEISAKVLAMIVALLRHGNVLTIPTSSWWAQTKPRWGKPTGLVAWKSIRPRRQTLKGAEGDSSTLETRVHPSLHRLEHRNNERYTSTTCL